MTNNKKEARKEAQKKWYEKNREAILLKRAKYYQEHKAELQDYGREYDRKRRSKKKVDTSKQSDDSSLKATAELKNRLLQELNDY